MKSCYTQTSIQNNHPHPQEEDSGMKMDAGRDGARDTGQQKSLREGEIRAGGQAVITVLEVRGIPVSAVARERILAEKNRVRLLGWLKKAAVATTLADVLKPG